MNERKADQMWSRKEMFFGFNSDSDQIDRWLLTEEWTPESKNT